ncbi:hypothetical protein OnM2_073035 [Erysiphe neolycopersici]|uniref:Uncharacterized protein n=1 Tax=Erysiphe neolycopersici TaxID=212602 RepID=A0A420HJF3_9PEZI|nr:hypothetical protein OnM2_073035 [Erysiphe neolycopersici]
MSSMNWVLSPPMILDSVTSSMNLSSKRKRENSVSNSECEAPPEMPLAESQALIKDLIQVLEADDPTPSILTRSIPDLPRLSGPESKRQKAGELVAVEDGESSTSIIGRLSSNAYTTVDEVLGDIDAAVNEIVDKLDLSNSVGQNQCSTTSRAPSELSIKIMAFSKRAHDLVKKGKASWEKIHKTNTSGISHDYIRFTSQDDFSQLSSSTHDNKLVLTLFGNAPTPKQLFSSFQQPTTVNGIGEGVAIPIREMALPNGVSTTRIITTYPSSATDSKKRAQNMGEIFPTLPNITPSIPPRSTSKATTKSSNVGWYYPANFKNSSKSPSYFNQGISSGQWIDYSKPKSSISAHITMDKDKAKDLDVDKGISKDSESADLDADNLESLFRSAYSSFAPTKDNAAAIAPTGCLDQIWWYEIGKKRFNDLVQFSNVENDMEVIQPYQKDLNEDLLNYEKDIEELERNKIDPNLSGLQCETEKAIQEKEINEVLEEISQLLEILASYQQIRHLSLNTPHHSTTIYSTASQNSLGTPPQPCESEISTYEILKSQLSLMISSLPPYAVAKLNSDRLADLSISTKIEVQLNDHRGVMEEDESYIRQKMTSSVPTAISSPRPSSQSIHRSGSASNNSSSHYGNQIASPQSRGPTAQYFSPAQTPIRPTAQYYNSGQTPLRPSPSNIQRPTATVQGPYQAQRPSSTGPFRTNTYGTSSYPHQPTRSTQPLFTSSGQHLPYSQTPVSQGYVRAQSQNLHHQHGSQSAPQTTISNNYSSVLNVPQ